MEKLFGLRVEVVVTVVAAVANTPLSTQSFGFTLWLSGCVHITRGEKCSHRGWGRNKWVMAGEGVGCDGTFERPDEQTSEEIPFGRLFRRRVGMHTCDA